MPRLVTENGNKCRRLAIFNHKGGVGKTTLTANIACALAAEGQRVLLVDADPQCNLTSYFVEDSVVDDLLDGSDSSTGQTLWSAVKPLVDSDGRLRLITPFELTHDGVLLLPGDILLSEFEELLAESWTDCFKRRQRGFSTTTAISSLVSKIITKYRIDFVFYDSGPNIGPLNRVILLDCDFFIVPAACDLFSLRALKTLGHALVKWISEWDTISMLAPDNVTLISGRPAFLGYIPQRFRVYGEKPTMTFAKIMPRLERSISSEVVSRLKEIDNDLARGTLKDLKLGQVKDFSLAADAQHQGMPMWLVDGGNNVQRLQSRQAFMDIAKAILAKV